MVDGSGIGGVGCLLCGNSCKQDCHSIAFSFNCPAENHRYNLPMTLGKVCPKDSIADLDVGSKIFSANEAIFCGDGWFL